MHCTNATAHCAHRRGSYIGFRSRDQNIFWLVGRPGFSKGAYFWLKELESRPIQIFVVFMDISSLIRLSCSSTVKKLANSVDPYEHQQFHSVHLISRKGISSGPGQQDSRLGIKYLFSHLCWHLYVCLQCIFTLNSKDNATESRSSSRVRSSMPP